MDLVVETKDHIVIAGATGRTGRIIVQKLLDLDRAMDLRLLVRDPDHAHDLFGKKAAVITSDARDYASLLPAFSGATTLISAIGSRSPVGRNCPKRVDYEGVTNLVRAAEQAGVDRFILISSIAVTHPEHPMNQFGKILEWKQKGEQALRASGLSHTIIRPGGLKDTPGGQHTLTFGRGDRIMGLLSRSDLAETCLQALFHPQSAGLTFEVIESGSRKPTDWKRAFKDLSSK